jgi:protein-tyrosine-phosphatase
MTAVVGPLLMMVGTLLMQPPSGPDPTVVFVCEHGAAKSVIATAYFNKMAEERGLRARAIYRGVNPDAALSTAALKGLRDDGLPVPTERPSRIADGDVDSARVIFAIGCTLPPRAVASGKADNWNDVPGDQGYAAMRDAVKKHVERLVANLVEKQRTLQKQVD